MSYDLHLSTGIGRPQETQCGAGNKEELCFLLRQRDLEPGEAVRFWDRRRISAFSDKDLTSYPETSWPSVLICPSVSPLEGFSYQPFRSLLSKFRLCCSLGCLLWIGRTGYCLFSLQHSFQYLLCPSFFLSLINSLRLCLEVTFRVVQGSMFCLFFSVPGDLGSENGHSLFTDVCMWV